MKNTRLPSTLAAPDTDRAARGSGRLCRISAFAGPRPVRAARAESGDDHRSMPLLVKSAAKSMNR